MGKLSAAIRRVLDIPYPRVCVKDQVLLKGYGEYDYLCTQCAADLLWIKDPACKTCGYPFHGKITTQKSCVKCIDLKPEFDCGKSLLLFEGAIREYIHDFKYNKGLHLKRDFGRLLRQQYAHLKDFFEDAVIIPVPLHWMRYLWRGYNQSQVLTEVIHEVFKTTSIQRCLKRVRYTKTQAFLKKKERLANVKNAFALKRKVVIMSNNKYILIDDVFTTGATLNACARVLKDAGAQQVSIFTLAHG